MRKLVAILSFLSFAAVLGMSSALATVDPDDAYMTGCLKDKSRGAKIKNALRGKAAGKDCDDVTLVQDNLTDDLQNQINNNNANLQSQITANANKSQENMDRIDALEIGGISSMFGGGHNHNTDYAANKTLYFPMTSAKDATDSEAFAQAKLAATGWITKIAVVANIGPGTDNDLAFIPRLQKPDEAAKDAFLNPLVGQQCVISDDQTMCTSVGCVAVDMGDLLAVKLLVVKFGAGDAKVRPARITARFVETEADCPPLDS